MTHNVNVPLLRKTLEHITANRTEWDQGSWGVKTACGTSHCLAGHAVLLHGEAELIWEGRFTEFVKHPDGRRELIPNYARDILGLNEIKGSMFAPGLSLETLWHMANRETKGEIEVPPEFL